MRLDRKLTLLRPELLAFATSLTLDRTAAEDLVHDAILRALEARSAPRALADLRPWMFRVLRNIFIDGKRRERTRREFSRTQDRLLGIGAAPAADPIETMLVRQALARLSAHEREILGLVDILGLSYAEAAEVIGTPVGTVMSRVSRARRAMLTALGESNVRPLSKRMG